MGAALSLDHKNLNLNLQIFSLQIEYPRTIHFTNQIWSIYDMEGKLVDLFVYWDLQHHGNPIVLSVVGKPTQWV